MSLSFEISVLFTDKCVHRFDVEKSGIMVEQDFISGWLNLAIEMQSDEWLRRIAFLLGDNNMLL